VDHSRLLARKQVVVVSGHLLVSQSTVRFDEVVQEDWL
jgi:hypothetical protein